MDIHEEISKAAYDLYEKSGCIKGRDDENWLEAERIVLDRRQSPDKEQAEAHKTNSMETKSNRSSIKLKRSKQQ